MAIPYIDEGYDHFPYPSEEGNVAAIDALKTAYGLYYLPKLLGQLNEAAAATLALGCGFWSEEGRYYSYIEFGWQNETVMPKIEGLDEAFLQWTMAHCEEFANVHGIIVGNVEWTRRTVFHVALGHRIEVLTFMVCGLSVYEVEYVYQALQLFLNQLSK